MLTQAERKEKEEKVNDLITRAEDVLNVAKDEKRELTDAEAQELAEIRDDVRKIKEFLQLDDDFKKLEEMKVKKDVPKEEEEMTEETMKEKEIQEVRAFENFLRGWEVHERSGELTPSTTGTSGNGGVLIPQTIVNYIIKKLYNICPILERSQKYNVKGKLEVPYYPADSTYGITVAYKSEFSALSSTAGNFATVELTGFLAGCMTKISRSLINNTQFDIVGFVVDEMAYAIKRFIEGELLKGTQNKVAGLSGLTNSVTAAAQNAITADEIIKLHDKVLDDYQQNAIWIMSPATRTALRLLKDSMGRYLLQDDITAPFGSSLLGKPVYVSDNMPDMAHSARAIFYGDMHGLGTKFNEDINIEVLRERFADEHAIGVVGWFEFDAKVINEQQMAVLVMA